MQIKLINCPVCETSNWHDLDYLRDRQYWYDRDYIYDEPIGFKICKECGFVTYDYIDNETLKKRYEDYRKIIDLGAVVTTFRKLEYHKAFLKDVNFDLSKVLDYGCGIGYFLDWINKTYREPNCFGVEINDQLINYARSEYGLHIFNYIPKENYDFISCYRTLEHIQYPEKLLQKFYNCLNEDGYLYLSVPVNIQEDILDEDAGLTTNEFEEFYHLHHVNVFSKQSFKNLLWKYGFDIIKENEVYYGYTVLCKKNDKLEIWRKKENYEYTIGILELQKKAIELYKQEKFAEARALHTGYVDAWSMNAIKQFKDLQGQEKLIKEGLIATKGSYKLKRQLAFLYYQWDQNKAGEKNLTNHIRESKRLWEELIEMKPGIEDYYYYLAMIEVQYYKNYEKAHKLFEKVLEINPTKWGEICNLIGWIWKEKDG